MKKTKLAYQQHLNEIGTPQAELRSNGGRVYDFAKWGNWMRKNDPIAFEVGFRDWKNNY